MYTDVKPINKSYSHGFTIVELIVVIVVIGVLATITIIAYTGIQQKAIAASLQSDLTNMSYQLKFDQVETSGYPATLAAANNGKSIPASPGTTYQYTVDNSATPQTFCATATKGTISYKITNNSPPVAGVCPEYGLVLRLDIGDASSYPGTGTVWTDTSGNGNNATLMNGVGYDGANGGSLIFDGVDDYATVTNNPSLDFSSGQTLIIIMKHSFIAGRRNPWDQAYGGYGTWTHESGNSINQYYGNSGINNNPYVSVGSPVTPRDVWNFMGATRDTSNFKWYINGALSSTSSNPYGKLANTPANIRIGSGYAGFWQGKMSVVIAYNRSLSASEIQQIFNDLRGRYGI